MRFLVKKSGRPSQRVPLGDHDRESMREDDGMRMRVVVDLYFGQKNRLQVGGPAGKIGYVKTSEM